MDDQIASLHGAATRPSRQGSHRAVSSDIRLAYNKGEWTGATVAALKVLYALDYSTSAIGDFLGFSKNSIVGKVHRLGLDGRPSPIIQDGRTPDLKPRPVAGPTLPPLPSAQEAVECVAIPRSPTAAPRMSRVVRALAVTLPVVTFARKGVKPEPIPFERARTVVAPRPFARTKSCLFPIGEPGTPAFRFCDEPHQNRSYCAEHEALCWVKVRREDFAA
jgi:GcrA cell cycle regulator